MRMTRAFSKMNRGDAVLEREECIARYRQLLQLLEEDGDEIESCFQGDMLDAYRAILAKEKDILSNAISSIQFNY